MKLRVQLMIAPFVVLVLSSGCHQKPQDVPADAAERPALRPVRRQFFVDTLASRPGKHRDSLKSFDLPAAAKGPFAVLLDYRVASGSVIVELNEMRVFRAEAFESEAGSSGEPRRLEREVAIPDLESNEIYTNIASLDAGYAKVQIVGYLDEANQ